MKECSAFPRVRKQWTWEGRMALQKLWNENVNRGRRALTMRAFAEAYRLSHGRVQRELKAGFSGVLLRDKVHGGWIYPEYSALKAQQRAEKANADKGRRSVVTTTFANRLIEDFLKKGHTIATCLYTLRGKGWTHLPSQRAVYYHLKDGVIVLPKGHLCYRPRKMRRRSHPRRGKILPERRSIEERPPEVLSRQRFGDWEMDCVVSGRTGRGGLLVLIERRTRYVLLRQLRTISQSAVHRTLRRLVAEGALRTIHSMTTDRNAPKPKAKGHGCEFLDQRTLERILHAPVYYTHAYASWEKGSVEHANGLLRFWFRKGTDFSKVSPAEIDFVQNQINAISRTHSLKGLTAHEAFLALS